MIKYIIDSSSLDELEDRYPKDISVFEPIYIKLNQMFENEEVIIRQSNRHTVQMILK